MSEIILPGSEKEEKEEELKYDTTPEDEERFFLMYHMNFQPSEVDHLSADYRKWLIARFMAQKNIEREAMERHRIMSTIGGDLTKGPGPHLRLHE